jgi:hypothetical protein
MSALNRFLAFLLAVLRALLYGWILALIELLRILWRRLQDCLARERLPGRLSKTSTSRCVKVSDPAFKRPDPMIYDQYYLMSQGLAVTWDNPDMHIELGGVTVPPHTLKPNTNYDVIARVWNNSTEAPVVDMPVIFSFLSFGMGTQVHSIGQTKVTLDVKGGPSNPAFAKVPWKTPPAPGHYCVQAFLDWADDLNPNNNLGQTNTDVVAAHSPATFGFQLRNNSQTRQAYRFEVDAYAIPPLGPCDQKQRQPDAPQGTRLAPGTVMAVPPQHDRRNALLPSGWTVTFNPPSPLLAPADEITVEGTATPPPGFHGRQNINVHAIDGNGLAGGITIYVDVP